MTITHEMLKRVVQSKPGDYKAYGGEIERWGPSYFKPHPHMDCSMGCKWFAPLEGVLGYDWGVCARPDGERRGLLTFEHQSGGNGCFESDEGDC